MTDLSQGANAPLETAPLGVTITLPRGAEIDVTALQLYADGRVRGDDDMCFYGQPEIAGGTVRFTTGQPSRFDIDLASIDALVEKIVLTATVDGQTPFGDLGDVVVSAGSHRATVCGAGRSERALILVEIYRRNGSWKIRHVGQGFDGGLAALATHFGIEIAAEDMAGGAGAKAADTRTVDLAKRLVTLEKTAPAMVSLVKAVGVSLEKKGHAIPRAKVALVLDISGSMMRLFSDGTVDALVRRALALGLTFDDDGEIDVFLFGRDVHEYGTVTAATMGGFARRAIKDHPLEGGTRYGAAMKAVRAFYQPDFGDGLPVMVFFVTDGGTDDKPLTRRMITESADEPIFWKLMGIIADNSFAARRSGFLQELDDLPGRRVDNCDYFNVSDPRALSDAEFYENVLEELPEWLRDARAEGVLQG